MCKAAHNILSTFFNEARIIFYRPTIKWEEGQWQPVDLVYKGTGTHWCKCCNSDQTTTLKNHHPIQIKRARLLGPPYHICLQNYPLSIRPAVVIGPVPQ